MAAKEKISLSEVTLCCSEHTTAEREGEMIVLFSPRFKYPWMQRFLVSAGMSKELHMRLEEHDTAVWELIDGERNVREIIEKLADHFQNEGDYESRVLAHLSQMQKDRSIKLVIPVAQIGIYISPQRTRKTQSSSLSFRK